MKSDTDNDLSKLRELWLVDFNPKNTKPLVVSTSTVPLLDL
jgi:hypothetical protein